MKKQETKRTSRRKFLRDSATAGAGAAMVATSPGSALTLTEIEQEKKKSEGYRMTAHISAYYKTAAE
ncbi:MAG: twin-arginine translocation signal domain-containing protein [Arenicellales bacterium]